jgi:hypothetical protein
MDSDFSVYLVPARFRFLRHIRDLKMGLILQFQIGSSVGNEQPGPRRHHALRYQYLRTSHLMSTDEIKTTVS